MTAVLGIDAAWTANNPSGVAVVRREKDRWRVVAAANSYRNFIAKADRSLAIELRPKGSRVDAVALLSAAAVLAGTSVDLVAVDIPLSRVDIVGRRSSDNAVSHAYGARHCSTHTPSATRPGRTGRDLSESFRKAGYALQTIKIIAPALIEVYPHPALVELAMSARRLPYKISKIRSYWPTLTRLERRERLFAQWREIATLLERELPGVLDSVQIPETSATTIEMKAYEDVLDSIVCAWVGVCALEGRAEPFGDEQSAIWIPRPLERTITDR